MAFAINEKWESGDWQAGQSPSDEMIYMITGDPNPATDDADFAPVVQAWAKANIDQSFNGNTLSDLKGTRVTAGTWLVTATYSAASGFTPSGESEFAFSTGGGTQHFSHALNHVKSYTLSDDASTTSLDPTVYDGWLNPGADGSVGGIDAPAAEFNFTVTLYIAAADMTEAYIRLLYMLTGTVNATAFTCPVNGIDFAFDEGEVIFFGASGAKRGNGDWELTMNFRAAPNQEELVVGGGDRQIIGIAKKGQQFLSVVTAVGAKDHFIGPVLQTVLIDDVFPSDNWTGLVRTTTTVGLTGGGL